MIFLFDLDGVIVDTESQYTRHWNAMGEKYLGKQNFGITIKGQTLVQILDQYVEDPAMGVLLEEAVDKFEKEMDYEFVPGAYEFLKKVKEAGIPSAIVTSSNEKKMAKVYEIHPDLKEMVSKVLTSEYFTRSKPDPECFLKGMEILGGTPESTIVFEDSIHGLAAGRGSGAHVVGLTTTNGREVIGDLCDMAIDNFEGISIEGLAEALGISTDN